MSTHPFISKLTEPRRAYLYRVALAVIAILVLVGLLTEESVAEWAELVAALLGVGTTGLAVGNTSTR